MPGSGPEPEADEAALFRVQPDTPPAPPRDEGIHSWPFGSYAPMGFYRPVPIVRFARTVLAQFVASFVLQSLLVEAPGAVTIGACTLLTLVLARRAFVRWLGRASLFWKVATLAALALNLGFFSVITLARGCGPGRLAAGLEQAPAARSAVGEGCQPSTFETGIPRLR